MVATHPERPPLSNRLWNASEPLNVLLAPAAICDGAGLGSMAFEQVMDQIPSSASLL